MMSYTLDSKDRIIKATCNFYKDRPFFSYIILAMNVEQTKSTKEIPTMAVNGYGDLLWNEEFVNKMSNEELEFCLGHEVMHVATLTFDRKGSRDMSLWNIATDIAINMILRDEGFKHPKDILMPDHNGIFTFNSGKTGKMIKIDCNQKTAEEIYEELAKHAKTIQVVFQTDGEGNYKGQMDKHLPGKGKDGKGKDSKEPSEADKQANKNKWKQKIAEAACAAKMRGKMSNSLERELGGLLEPKVDWRKRLHQYITQDLPVDFTMRRPGRRFYTTGFYTPYVLKENLEVIVGVDVSGSIGPEEYNEFVSECMGIANSFAQIKMRLICWATHVDEHDDIEVNTQNKERLLKFKPCNSGGTTLSCFTDYCRQKNYKSRIYVILTDGYTESSPKLPNGNILFVLSKHGTTDIIGKLGYPVCSLNDRED